MKYFLIVILSIVFLQSTIKAEQSDLGLSFKINKSLAILPLENYTQESNNNFEDEFKLVTGTFGFGANLLFKIKRRTYFDLGIEYNFLSINDSFKPTNNEDLTAAYAKVSFGGISYIDPPDEFTPFFGYGTSLMFVNSNQNDVITEDEYENDPIKGDLLAEFTLSLDYRAGLLIPINEQFSVSGNIEISLVFATYVGLVPSVQFGAVYWLDKKE